MNQTPRVSWPPGHYGTVVGSRARGRSRDARPGVSSLAVSCLPPVCRSLHSLQPLPGAWWLVHSLPPALARRLHEPPCGACVISVLHTFNHKAPFLSLQTRAERTLDV